MSSTEPPDDLHDAALAEDIALLGDMMAAAADGGHALSDAEVDEALGLPARGSAAERTRSRRSPHRLRRRWIGRARRR